MEESRGMVPDFIIKLQNMMNVTNILFRPTPKRLIGAMKDSSLSSSIKPISGKQYYLTFLNMENSNRSSDR
jgi:hypothetical protein